MDYKEWNDRIGLIAQLCTLVAFLGAFVVWLMPDLRPRLRRLARNRWRAALKVALAAVALTAVCLVVGRPFADTSGRPTTPDAPPPPISPTPTPADFSNSVGITMVYVPGGLFQRQSANDERTAADRPVVSIGVLHLEIPITRNSIE